VFVADFAMPASNTRFGSAPSVAKCKSITLTAKCGEPVIMPVVALGLWKVPADAAFSAVTSALDGGYRHLDCAPVYRNQAIVGAAITAYLTEHAETLSRRDLFITSKVFPSPTNMHDNFENDVRNTLRELDLKYLDLCLIHWPFEYEESSLEDMWMAMEDLVKNGLVKAIGVSNFSSTKLKRILEIAEIPVSVNQVEMHAMFRQEALVNFCNNNGVHVTAYGPLGSGDQWASDGLGRKCAAEERLLSHPETLRVAKSAGCTPAQALIAWIVHHRMCSCAPKSVNPSRQAENIAAGSRDFVNNNKILGLLSTLDKVEPQVRLQHGAFHTGPPESGKCFRTLEELWDEDVSYMLDRDFERPEGFMLRPSQ